MNWTGKTVVVTGISGFIARHLAETLGAEGATVLGVSRTAPERNGIADTIPFYSLDLRDFAAVCAFVQERKPDAVFHLAAVSVLHAASDEDGARAMLETNVAATWNVLEACRRAGTPSLVVTASDKQYGALARPPYQDDDSTAFGNGGLYELSKAQQDQSARLYAGLYDVPAIRIARLVNIYGPGDTQWTRIIPGTIRRTVTGEPPRITSGPAGEALREYVFIDDAIRALLALASDATERGNAPLRRPDGRLARVAFNIGGPHRHAAESAITIIQNVLREEFGVTGPAPLVQPGPSGAFEPGHQFSNFDKLRELLPDWNPIPLDEGIRHTIPWYLEYLQR